MNTILKLQSRLPLLFPPEETDSISFDDVLLYKKPNLFVDHTDSVLNRPWLSTVDQSSFRSIVNFIAQACGQHPELEDLRKVSESTMQSYLELEDERVTLELALEERLDALCVEMHKKLDDARKRVLPQPGLDS